MVKFIVGLSLGLVIGYFGPVYCFKKTANVVSSAMHGTGNVIGSVAK